MVDLPPCVRNIGATDKPCEGCTGEETASGGFPPCSRRTLLPGQHLFFQDDSRSHVHLVTSGALRLYKMLCNGRRQVIGFKYPGDFVTLGRAAKYRFCAQAIRASTLRVFPAAAFDAAADKDLRLLSKLYESVSADLASAHDLILTVGQRDAEASVAAFLLEIDAPAALEDSGLVLPMLRTDIADYLGLTHETVSRIFSAFKRRGLIELAAGRRVRLKNRQALKALAGGTNTDRAPRSVMMPTAHRASVLS